MQDTILNSVMAVLTIIATIIVIIIAVVLFFIVLVFNGTIVVAAFALPIVSTYIQQLYVKSVSPLPKKCQV